MKPRVITRFEPWMALTFSEGSIGGDIEQVSILERGFEAFYGEAGPSDCRRRRERIRASPIREPGGLERHRHRARGHTQRATRCC